MAISAIAGVLSAVSALGELGEPGMTPPSAPGLPGGPGLSAINTQVPQQSAAPGLPGGTVSSPLAQTLSAVGPIAMTQGSGIPGAQPALGAPQVALPKASPEAAGSIDVQIRDEIFRQLSEDPTLMAQLSQPQQGGAQVAQQAASVAPAQAPADLITQQNQQQRDLTLEERLILSQERERVARGKLEALQAEQARPSSRLNQLKGKRDTQRQITAAQQKTAPSAFDRALGPTITDKVITIGDALSGIAGTGGGDVAANRVLAQMAAQTPEAIMERKLKEERLKGQILENYAVFTQVAKGIETKMSSAADPVAQAAIKTNELKKLADAKFGGDLSHPIIGSISDLIDDPDQAIGAATVAEVYQEFPEFKAAVDSMDPDAVLDITKTDEFKDFHNEKKDDELRRTGAVQRAGQWARDMIAANPELQGATPDQMRTAWHHADANGRPEDIDIFGYWNRNSDDLPAGMTSSESAKTRATTRAKSEVGPAFVNQFGDLVQLNKATGKQEKVSTAKDDGSGAPDPAKVAKAEQDMRRDFTKLAGPFAKFKTMYSKVLASSQDPSAAGDISMIFAYMKLLDPESVVREGEQATAANARGVPETLRTMYNRTLLGTRLGPDQRDDFVDRATRLMETEVKTQLQTEDVFRGLSDRNALESANVVLDFVGPELREFFTRRGRTIQQSDIDRAAAELGEAATKETIKERLLSEGMVFDVTGKGE